MRYTRTVLMAVAATMWCAQVVARAEPIGTAFTYQGQLKEGGVPADGSYDLDFTLYDSATSGDVLAGPIVFADHSVSNGLFTVELDFEADVFKGNACWLEIGVRVGGDTGSYTYLSPRQRLTPTPYALALPGLWTEQNAECPNVIGGHRENTIGAGVHGATIAGGGYAGSPNSVTGSFGTVGGGQQNAVLNNWATVAGGIFNVAGTTEPGGGGPGGAGAFVGGGAANQASGQSSVVPGGENNVAAGAFSLAAGWGAQALHDGAFVWRDSSEPLEPFESTGENQFLIKATGGVGIGLNSPTVSLHVNGGVRARGGPPGSQGANDNGYTFFESGDNDSGMFSTGDGSVEFYTNAQERMRIAPGGRVGIGTPTPEAALDLNGEMIHRGGAFKHLGHDLIIADPARGDGGRALVHEGDGTNERLVLNFTNDFNQGTVVHGNLGIGRIPAAKLDIGGGDIHLEANHELLFADNGQIRSRDDKHRVLFRRDENKLELREYGDIIFSAGATAGEETASVVVKASGRVGIGTDDPAATLHVQQAASLPGSNTATFECVSENGTAVLGHNLAAGGAGVRGIAESEESVGVHGTHNSTTGDVAGVLGETSSWGLNAAGVLGRTAPGDFHRFGVYGKQGTSPNYVPASGAGVYGHSDVQFGVVGYTSGITLGGTQGVPCGVYGFAWGGESRPESTGVYGASLSDTGYGGQFHSYGYGALGETSSTDNQVAEGPAGLQAEGGTAIRGVSTVAGGNGVIGIANDTLAYGVYGESDVGHAGHFEGYVLINGDLGVTGDKNFVIDHPLEPATKYLAHSCVESSERLNLYRGNVLLDEDGKASVQLPDWFDSVNANISYQLTAVGAAAPSLHVAQKIENNEFRIAGGVPGMEVSWTVMAERADPYARGNPFVAERIKPEHERGYYLQPQLYGHGKEKGMVAAKAALSARLQSDLEVIAEQERRRAEMRKRWPVPVRREDKVTESTEAHSDLAGG